MMTTTVLKRGPVTVRDHRCRSGPGDKPFAEQHGGWSAYWWAQAALIGVSLPVLAIFYQGVVAKRE